MTNQACLPPSEWPPRMKASLEWLPCLMDVVVQAASLGVGVDVMQAAGDGPCAPCVIVRIASAPMGFMRADYALACESARERELLDVIGRDRDPCSRWIMVSCPEWPSCDNAPDEEALGDFEICLTPGSLVGGQPEQPMVFEPEAMAAALYAQVCLVWHERRARRDRHSPPNPARAFTDADRSLAEAVERLKRVKKLIPEKTPDGLYTEAASLPPKTYWGEPVSVAFDGVEYAVEDFEIQPGLPTRLDDAYRDELYERCRREHNTREHNTRVVLDLMRGGQMSEHRLLVDGEYYEVLSFSSTADAGFGATFKISTSRATLVGRVAAGEVRFMGRL